MHQQIRTKVSRSPADLVQFLDVLANNGFDLATAGGWKIEGDGYFAFTVKDPDHDDANQGAHGQLAAALQLLRDEGYDAHLYSVSHAMADDVPGGLAAALRSIQDSGELDGRAIMDIALGGANADHQVPVQVYSEVVEANPDLID